MIFTKYDDLKPFGDETLEILLENEVQNNLIISFIKNERKADTKDWLLASVKDESSGVLLTAACTPPFNVVLYETRNKPSDMALKLLAEELKSLKFDLPGVIAEKNTAMRFAEQYAGAGKFSLHSSMNVMRLDEVNNVPKAPGSYRPLKEDDLFYVPYWEHSFSEECKIEVHTLPEDVERVKQRIGKDTHFIWEDGIPVSQAANTRNTENGGGISAVYTPPHYRGKGYASSLVAEGAKIILRRGFKFCYLFADAENPTSCGIYRRIGFYDICEFSTLNFTK